MIEREIRWSEKGYSFKILTLNYNIYSTKYSQKPELDYAYSIWWDTDLITLVITRNKNSLE